MANNRMPRKGGPRGFGRSHNINGNAPARRLRMLSHQHLCKLA